MKQSTQSRCTATTQRDGTGREMGGGFRMGTHGHPWWFMSMYGKNHYNVVTSLQLNLKNKMKKGEVTLEKIMFH